MLTETILPYINKLWGLLQYDAAAPMLFNTGLFLWWFLVLMAFLPLFQRKHTGKIIYLTAFSFFFYYKASGFYFVLLIISTLVDFYAAKWMYNANTRSKKRVFLLLSIFSNLGMLAYFKYTDFFIGTLNSFLENPLAFQNIFLPVGISFYTFQTLSYTFDVYRDKLKPVNNILDFGFYVSFFPQLVAGPIVRARDFLPQIRNPKIPDKAAMGTAVALIASGLIKKAIISDYISVNFVDRIFESPLLYSGIENLMGVYGYALQIYCDFSGYSDVAIGLALLMGFALPINFNYPYRALSITDFWRRWHISLSTWLRDYLYIPLGGNRKGQFRQYINLMITMLLGGLWHGPAWKFVIWGGMHGLALAVEKLFGSVVKLPKRIIFQVLAGIITFHIVCFGWIYFRAPSTESAMQMINQIVYVFKPEIFFQLIVGYKEVFLVMLIGYLIHFTPVRLENGLRSLVIRTPIWGQALIIVAVIWMIVQTKSAAIVPYIYFQF